MRAIFLLAILGWAGAAAADLYRWVDPESGSVKISNAPPPWYGDPAKQRRAPKVQVIPSGGKEPITPEPGEKLRDLGTVLEGLEARRKAMLLQFPPLVAQSGSEGGAQALQRHVDEYTKLADQIDKIYPQGAAARRGEMQMAMDKIVKGGAK